jgi:hypothetical protein
MALHNKILVVSIDTSKKIIGQLAGIARTHDLSVLEVTEAWRQQRHFGPTETSLHDILPNLHFTIVKEQMEQKDFEDLNRKNSYRVVKERNKFFDRKRR